MKYKFWRDEEVWETDTPMSNISDLQRKLEADGWHRVWEVPRLQFYLGYVESLEESTAMLDDDDRVRAGQRKEAQEDIRRALANGDD